MGDIKINDYRYWFKKNEDGSEPPLFVSYFAVAIVWFFWITNIFSISIIMLNLLIA